MGKDVGRASECEGAFSDRVRVRPMCGGLLCSPPVLANGLRAHVPGVWSHVEQYGQMEPGPVLWAAKVAVWSEESSFSQSTDVSSAAFWRKIAS